MAIKTSFTRANVSRTTNGFKRMKLLKTVAVISKLSCAHLGCNAHLLVFSISSAVILTTIEAYRYKWPNTVMWTMIQDNWILQKNVKRRANVEIYWTRDIFTMIFVTIKISIFHEIPENQNTYISFL
ncbi:8601_t:CDS:2 [Funneliformis caledonium]|uniref:8601_t:CDS:1 n=1 Tax=Funneliformis caledonium TaxID=1117310 RepID=A0A9N9F913_9GLOM|nr:8601_t:CDS:2 [Funneliformis caledonium]